MNIMLYMFGCVCVFMRACERGCVRVCVESGAVTYMLERRNPASNPLAAVSKL